MTKRIKPEPYFFFKEPEPEPQNIIILSEAEKTLKFQPLPIQNTRGLKLYTLAKTLLGS